jgi:hypothetical protein
MKIRSSSAPFLAALAAAWIASPAAAVQNPEDVATGERFRRPNVSIDTETRLPDGGLLLKGSPADVEVQTLGQGKVKATFFQGGMRKGEANGILVINSRPPRRASHGPDGKSALTLTDFGLDANAPYAFVKGAGKLDLVFGNPGANQILIGLLLPAVQVSPVLPPQNRGAGDPPDPDKQPRRADPPGEVK